MFFVCFVLHFGSALAQTVTGTLTNTTRVESWSYFTPPPDAGTTPDYTFFSDRAEIGARVEGVRFDIAAAFNYVRLENLPSKAIGPGGLGAGAFYFESAGIPFSYQLYMSELMMRIKSKSRRASFAVGRMHYASGLESRSHSPALQQLKEDRIASRLVGEAEWTTYQRRFDGARFDLDRSQWHFSATAYMPTQGTFEESAILTMPKVQVASVTATRESPSHEWQAFSHLYRDRRGVSVRPDNEFRDAAPARVTIATLGGSFVGIRPTTAGDLDTVAWGALQAGDWYGQPHRAVSVALEAGHRWTHASLRPWLRAGYLLASGDRNPHDDRHGTFFPMLASSRKYALSSVYSQMNIHDLFAELRVEPGRVHAALDLHRVDLASSNDLWYHGTGAMASKGPFFGYSGRVAYGETSLGTIAEGTVDVPVNRHWSLNGYVGRMWGGEVVRRSFVDTHLLYVFAENVIRF